MYPVPGAPDNVLKQINITEDIAPSIPTYFIFFGSL